MKIDAAPPRQTCHYAFIAAVFFSVFFQISMALAQGNLAPSGPPGPTMKSLDQIEARMPISSVPLTITNPGAYYLTTNLTVVGFNGNGITINADNVTLDLNGFTISGDGSGNNSGVQVITPHHNLCVRNGTIRNIGSGDGIYAPQASSSRYERLLLYANGEEGIQSGTAASLVDCVFQANGFLALELDAGSVARDCVIDMNGIAVIARVGCSLIDCTVVSNKYGGLTCGYGSHIKGCTFAYNSNSPAIAATNGCTISDCTVYSNPGGGIIAGQGCVITGCSLVNNSGGITCGDGSVVSGCSSQYNNGDGISARNGIVRDCNSFGNAGNGVYAAGSTVSGCVAQNNLGDGIAVHSGDYVNSTSCFITGNNVQGNDQWDSGYANIDVYTDNNRIENNFITEGGGPFTIGLQAYGTTNNVIIRNSSSQAFYLDYNLGTANDAGPIGSASSASSPWANFAH